MGDMGSLSAGQRESEEAIKKRIVDGYKRGVCTWEGGHIPKESRGAVGKGSRFMPARDDEYRVNYDRIFRKHCGTARERIPCAAHNRTKRVQLPRPLPNLNGGG